MTNEELRNLCIKNKWFTCGSVEQYEKLFIANELSYSINELALIIWICSDNIEQQDIISELSKNEKGEKTDE